MEQQLLNQFALLVLKMGVNLQEGQGLELSCPVEKPEIAKAFTISAYSLKAKYVSVRWEYQDILKLNYENADITALTNIPKWFIDSKNFLAKENYCYVAIDADDPDLLNGINSERLSKIFSARSKALKGFSEKVMKNALRWCVVSLPTEKWAKKVFKNKKNSQELLEKEIIKFMRLDTLDPVKAWEEHVATLEKHAKILNEFNFSYLRYKNGIGTDLKVGLAENHIWLSAREKALDGVPFIANMPTEEVFTAPHKDKIEGVVKSALPLIYNGNIIEDFSLTFKRGKIVHFSAKKGYETLKNLIATDKGTLSLGEVALIGKNSPIAKSGILFYNTLFDENASCHLAIGKGYPSTVKNGKDYKKSQLKKFGLNDSVEHVDFMIGTKDLDVFGITKDGKEVLIFKDGEWAI